MLARLGLPISPRIHGHIVVGVCIAVILFNSILSFQLAYLWSALKWEPETEWDEWRMNGVRVVVGLVCGYLLWTCLAAVIGLVGALKLKPSYLRFFRDCTIVDLVFSFTFLVISTLCASQASTRALLCEQLSRQPELLRSIANSGLNFENCESWFENAIVVFVCVMVITLVMRVQFTFTLSNFYTRLLRKHRLETLDSAPQRILLLPPSAAEDSIPLLSASQNAAIEGREEDADSVIVYAPVKHTRASAHELGATEAWVSSHRHGGHRRSESGRIALSIQPGEGLLPDNHSLSKAAGVIEPSRRSQSRVRTSAPSSGSGRPRARTQPTTGVAIVEDKDRVRLENWRFDRSGASKRV